VLEQISQAINDDPMWTPEIKSVLLLDLAYEIKDVCRCVCDSLVVVM
jgi:hypothetical protein